MPEGYERDSRENRARADHRGSIREWRAMEARAVESNIGGVPHHELVNSLGILCPEIFTMRAGVATKSDAWVSTMGEFKD